MKIVFITEFFSEKMGYSENCLAKAMASLKHEVHVIASGLQVYGNLEDYDKTYGLFLGARVQRLGSKMVDGYTLHRLPHRLYFGYVGILGLVSKVRGINPDIIQTINCISLNTLKIAIAQKFFGYKMFTECHQHLSIIKPYLRYNNFIHPKRIIYSITRTIPGRLVSLFTKKCFPIAPDCAKVAYKFYGVQEKKIRIISLGTDTDLFTPVVNKLNIEQRLDLRHRFGFSESEIVCIYTGRFSEEKNPLLLAEAVSELKKQGFPYRALFIGDGFQRSEIEAHQGNVIIPFVNYIDLPKYYRAADIGVWPTQESTSMLDVAACGVPIIVSDRMGDINRVKGNGEVYIEGDGKDLIRVLRSLAPLNIRRNLGEKGRLKMENEYSWIRVAKDLLVEYESALEREK